MNLAEVFIANMQCNRQKYKHTDILEICQKII